MSWSVLNLQLETSELKHMQQPLALALNVQPGAPSAETQRKKRFCMNSYEILAFGIILDGIDPFWSQASY